MQNVLLDEAQVKFTNGKDEAREVLSLYTEFYDRSKAYEKESDRLLRYGAIASHLLAWLSAYFMKSLVVAIAPPPAVVAFIVIYWKILHGLVLDPRYSWPTELFQNCSLGFLAGSHCLPFTLWKFSAVFIGLSFALIAPALLVLFCLGKMRAYAMGVEPLPARQSASRHNINMDMSVSCLLSAVVCLLSRVGCGIEGCIRTFEWEFEGTGSSAGQRMRVYQCACCRSCCPWEWRVPMTPSPILV